MPVCRLAMADGRRGTLREFLLEKGYQSDRDVPNRPIVYRGEFSYSRHSQGIWIIEPGPLSLGDGRVLNMTGARGTWKMESGAVMGSQA